MFEFKLQDLVEAQRIVSQLHIPSEFGVDDDLDMTDIEEQLGDIIDGDYFVSCGVSKAVIIIDDLPFVIKIPFNGRWVCDYYSEEDEDENEDERFFIEFTEANKVSPSDYCADERDKTWLIQNNGFGCFVPDMMYLCTVCSFDVYVQEKVIPCNENRKDMKPSADSLEKAEEGNYWDTTWAAIAIDMYGLEFFNKFLDWARKNCKDMMLDLHKANYGYDMSGRPVIFDISGFRD